MAAQKRDNRKQKPTYRELEAELKELKMSILIETEDGSLRIPVQVVRMADYSMDELFEKKLYILLPFYLFNFERQFGEIEGDREKEEALLKEYRSMKDRLEALVAEAEVTSGATEEDNNSASTALMDEFTRQLVVDMTKKVAGKLAEKFPRVKKGVETMFGGQILDYEAKRIRMDGWRDGLERGLEKGLEQGLEQGLARGIFTTVNIYRDEMKLDDPTIVNRIMLKFDLDKELAEKYVKGKKL